MTQFITLAGRKQVGKDTSAKMIAATLSLSSVDDVHIVHFADALKKACSVIFGIPLEDMETEEGKQKLTHIPWPRDYSYDPDIGRDLVDPRDHIQVSAWYPGTRHNQLMTVREILQFVGTDLFRKQMRADIWVESVFRQPYGENEVVIVADCRFPNEAIFAKENGLLIAIERDTGLASDGHASETALDDYTDYHYTIDNNGSFDDLHEKLGVILNANSLLA